MTRATTSVGAGLASARRPRPIRTGERIHVVGAAGAGASGSALLAQAAGAVVSGCDRTPDSPYTPALEAVGVVVTAGHDPTHVTGLPRPDRLAVTKALTAIEPDHPELVAARRLAIPVEPWQQAVADAAVGRTLVGIAGTHGKSTTAGWLVSLLASAGTDPSAFVGALLPASITGGLPATARVGRGPAFVVEADEYAGNFDAYRPAIAVLTNAEWDHPDVFADGAAVIDAFAHWLEAATASWAPSGASAPVLVVNVADAGAEAVFDRLPGWPGLVIATALTEGSAPVRRGIARGMAERYATAAGPAKAIVGRVVGADPVGTTVEIHGLDPLEGSFSVQLSTAGRHNAANALSVAGAAMALGTGTLAIRDGLARFAGVGRRLERRGEAAGVVVYDDYGHHPTAIRATLDAVRQREPGRRVWAVYEPLTYHRTAALLGEFADALAEADAVVVAEIWAGRDPDTTVTSAEALAAAVARARPELEIAAPGSVEATARWLASHVVHGDVVLVMGGGRSYRIAELLLSALG